MFAGPNGSGKSTLKGILDPELLGHYLNADDIEKQLNTMGRVDLKQLGFDGSSSKALDHLDRSDFLRGTGIDTASLGIVPDESEVVAPPGVANSYLASALVEFLRGALVESRRSFTFETVMSHPSKVEALRSARAAGFRTYLYFVGTEDPDVNVARVAERVRRGGHGVPEDKVRERYTRSMALLPSAARASDRAYIFDNSGMRSQLVVEITDGEAVTLHREQLPSWILRYLLEKT